MRRAGHVVEVFDDGHAVLGALDRRPFDLLLTGFVIPGMDGIALAREARKTNPAIKIMLMAGFLAMAMTSGRTQGGKAVPVISQPIHLRHLVDSLSDVLQASA
ncbi:MAG: response regulator [bacterium]